MRRPPAEIQRALGQAVRDLRTERRLTQEELAERAGIHAHYVSDIERGLRNVAIVNLTYLAEAFGLTAAELLGVAGV
jgi:transcriptional regulator with XRE-family HTH domain